MSLAVLGTSGCGQGPSPNSAQRNEPVSESWRRAGVESRQAANRHNLENDEERGGHTLRKHVARTDDQLRDRLDRERNISAASTWTDRETAEVVVGEGLSAERDRMANWMQRGYPRANLALHYDAGRVIGRSLRRGDDATVNCSSAVIVLRADGPNSFYILTTYPEARE